MKKPAVPAFLLNMSVNLISQRTNKNNPAGQISSSFDGPTQMSLLLDREVDGANFTTFAYLFDMIPKGKAYNKTSSEHSILERTICLDKSIIHIEQHPAAITSNKKGVEETLFHFPGKQEEKVLHAIQYICLSKGNVYYDDTKATLLYEITIHEIYKHLESINEKLNHKQIRDSILIMHYSNLTILSEDKKNRYGSTIFPDLVMNSSSKPGRKSIEESTIILSFHVLYKLGLQTGNVYPFPDCIMGQVHRSLPLKILKILIFHFKTAGKFKDQEKDNEFILSLDLIKAVSLEQLQSNVASAKSVVEEELQYLKEIKYIKSFVPIVEKERGKIVSCDFKIVADEKLVTMAIGVNKWYATQAGKQSRKELGIGVSSKRKQEGLF